MRRSEPSDGAYRSFQHSGRARAGKREFATCEKRDEAATGAAGVAAAGLPAAAFRIPSPSSAIELQPNPILPRQRPPDAAARTALSATDI